MADKIQQDLVYRASIQNDTAKGAAEIRSQFNRLRADESTAVAKMRAEAERNSRILRGSGMDREAGKVERRADANAELSELRVRTAEKIARNKENEAAYRAAMHAERRRIVERHRKNEVAEDVRFAKEDADAVARARKVAQQEARRKHGEGDDGGGGGHSIWKRVLGDQSTTGINDPLSLALTVGLGGMALGAAAVVTRAMADVAEKMIEVRELAHSASAEWNVWPREIGKSLPIVGSLVDLLDASHELISGDRHELEIRNRTLQQTVEFQEEMYHWRIKENAAIRERGMTLAETQRRTEGVGLRGSDVSRFEFGLNEKSIKDRAELGKKAADDELRENPIVKGAQKALDKWDREGAGERFNALAGANPDMLRRLTSGTFTNTGAMTKDERELAALYEERQRLLQSKKAAENSQRGATDRKKADIDAQAGAAVTENKARSDFFETRRREQLDLEAGSHATEMKASAGMTSAERERTAGNVGAAQRKALATSIEAEIGQAQIAAQAKWNEASEDERVGIMKRLGERIASITAKGAADLAELEKELGLDRIQRQHDMAKSEGEAGAAVEAERLRVNGDGYKAERVLREQAFASRIADLKQNAAREIAANKDNKDAINRQLAADIKRTTAEHNEQKRQAGEQEIAGRFGTTKELARGMRDSLDLEARAGSITASVEGKKLDIATKYAEKRAELNRLIRDPATMQAEKDLAKQQLNGLDAQEEKERKLSLFTGGGLRLAGMNIDAMGSGRAASISESMTAANRLSDFNKTQNGGSGSKQDAELAKAITALVTQLRENATRQPTAPSSQPGYNHHPR